MSGERGASRDRPDLVLLPVSCGALVEVAPFGTFGIDY
jgi:hypothetical protein